MKGKRAIAVLIAGLGLWAGSAFAATAAADIAALQQQMSLINQITAKFQAEATAQADSSFNALTWSREFGARLIYQSPAVLSAALAAPDLVSAQRVLYNASATSKPTPKHDDNKPLTINVLSTPCRVVDTRSGGGGLIGPANPPNPRFWVVSTATAATIAAQGGNPAGCGDFGRVDGFVFNVTVVSSGTPFTNVPNFLSVNHNGTSATASMTYYPGEIVSNFVTSLCDGCQGSVGDVGVFSSGTTHVVIDLVATLGTEAPAALDCTTIATDFSIVSSAGSTFSAVSANCAAGFTLTGGGIDTNYTGANIDVYQSSPEPATGGTHWRCRGKNNDFTSIFGPITGQCYAICCRSTQGAFVGGP